MAEINDKDLEQATGGIQFFPPVFDGSDGGSGGGGGYSDVKLVDLNGTCEMFERAMYSTGSQSTCANCRYIRKGSAPEDNFYYCDRGRFD